MIIKTADSRQQTADSRQQTADSRQQTADSRQQTADSRCHYFDFLRVAGAFAVIVIHVAASRWYTTDIHTFEWQVLNFWHGSIVRWAVPVFVMISGALFLSRDIPVRKIYSKYIFRIFTAFVFWSFVYAAHGYMKDRDMIKAAGHFLKGHFHMWFLYVIAGLYMIVPFVKRIAESESLTKYFLVLAFFFAFLFPEAVNLISIFSEKYGEFAGSLANRFYLQFVGGFTGYFLLGYFLNKEEISSQAIKIIYALGIAGYITGMLLSVTLTMITGEPSQIFYGNLTVNNLFWTTSVFIFLKSKFNYSSRIVLALSQYSFGAYLVHAAVILLVGKLGLNTLAFNPLLSIPVISVIVFVISFAISAVLNHIPFINKYIV